MVDEVLVEVEVVSFSCSSSVRSITRWVKLGSTTLLTVVAEGDVRTGVTTDDRITLVGVESPFLGVTPFISEVRCAVEVAK